MFTCSFENKGNAGYCEYLYTELKQQISLGILTPDEKLPSKRSLATHLGVSVITVANAYNLLIDEGYIYSIEKRGFFVTKLSTIKKTSLYRSGKVETYCIKKSNHVTQSLFENFRSNSTAYEKFPFTLWSKVMRKVLNSPHENLLQNQPAKGVFECRKAISDYLKRFRNMDVSPEQVVIGAGTEYLYGLAVQLLGRERVYAVENPGYKKIQSVIMLNGAECRPIVLDEYGIIPSSLQKQGASVVHVSPSHHFPTGIVMPVQRRRELLLWALDNNNTEKKISNEIDSKQKKYILEDDYDSEFRFIGKPLRTLMSTDESESVIYFNTFSKTLSPSYRISYMVLPLHLVQLYDLKMNFLSCTVSAFEQYALAQFINNGWYEKHLIRMKNYYRNLRNLLINTIKASKINPYIEIGESDAGLHFLLTISKKLPVGSDCIEIQKKLRTLGVEAPLLSEYFYNELDCSEENKHIFVLNYSGIKKEHITETIKRMETAFLRN